MLVITRGYLYVPFQTGCGSCHGSVQAGLSSGIMAETPGALVDDFPIGHFAAMFDDPGPGTLW